MNPTFYMSCTGCTRRSMDTERIRNYFVANGMSQAESPETADYLWVTTCGLTIDTEDKSIAGIEAFKDHKGELIVSGCLPAMNPKRMNKTFSGRIVPANNLEKVDEYFPEFAVKLSDIPDANVEFHEAAVAKVDIRKKVKHRVKKLHVPYFWVGFNAATVIAEKTRRLINRALPSVLPKPLIVNTPVFLIKTNNDFFTIRVSYGCAFACSYCSIKTAIGDLKSKPLLQIKAEAKSAVQKGQFQVNIVSSDTGSYGLDIDSNFPTLLKTILDADERITIEFLQDVHPSWILRYEDQLLELIKTGRIKSILTAAQSGNARILKLMRRPYRMQEFKRAIARMKKAYPPLKPRTQVIVGFPSETEEEFQETYDLVKSCRFDEVDIFQYFETDNMKSAQMTPKVPQEAIFRRMARLKRGLGLSTITHLSGDILRQYKFLDRSKRHARPTPALEGVGSAVGD